jgi:hypothetical protein
MDNAVALVQAYLRVNGYLTVTEFPVVEAAHHGGYRTATDLDILAFRFGRASVSGQAVTASGRSHGPALPVDPALDARAELPDMIIGEVKEGRASLNRGAIDKAVLSAALARFGCCDPEEARPVVQELIRRGRASMAHGHRVRLVAFGSQPPESASPPHEVILLGHVIGYLRAHLRAHWAVYQAADTKDPALAFLKLLEKAGGRSEGSADRGPKALDQ